MPEFTDLYRTVGRVGKTPEAKVLPDGRKVTSFSLAETLQYDNSDNATRWVEVTVFKDGLREAVQQSIAKGQLVGVTGTTLRERDYNGRTYYSMIAHSVGRVELLSPRASAPAPVEDDIEDF